MDKKDENSFKGKIKQYIIYPMVYALVSTFFWYYNGTRHYISFDQHMYKLIEFVLIYLMLCIFIDFILRFVIKRKNKKQNKNKK